MKNLADLKRAMVVGTVWECATLKASRFRTWGKTGLTTITRTVCERTEGRAHMEYNYNIGSNHISSIDFGSAKGWLFDGTNSATVLNASGQPVRRYTLQA